MGVGVVGGADLNVVIVADQTRLETEGRDVGRGESAGLGVAKINVGLAPMFTAGRKPKGTGGQIKEGTIYAEIQAAELCFTTAIECAAERSDDDDRDGNAEEVRLDSKVHADHMFKIGYLRSSYNDGGIDRILRWLTWVIPVATVFLFVNLLNAEEGWQDALLGTVAAAVASAPSEAVTVKVFAPFSFAAGTYVRFGKLAKGITWLALTLLPESFSRPVAGKVATVILTSAVPST